MEFNELLIDTQDELSQVYNNLCHRSPAAI